ncbi:uncharacterized protein LOC144434274 [Glandiceps talaboti]
METVFDSKAIEIPRRNDMTSVLFDDQFKNQHPVILTNLISTWLPVLSWTPAYLENALKMADDWLKVFVAHDNQHFVNHPEVTELISMETSDFFERVFGTVGSPDSENGENLTKKRFYLRTHSMPSTLYKDVVLQSQVETLVGSLYTSPPSKLNQPDDTVSRAEIGPIPTVETHKSRRLEVGSLECTNGKLDTGVRANNDGNGSAHGDGPENEPIGVTGQNYPFCKQSTMQLWIGTEGNVTPLHYDRNHGLLAEIVGRKELILFSPEDTSHLYPYPSYSERAHTSRVNLRDLKHEDYGDRFPRLCDAQRYHCILQPGELLYIPPFWWHDVTSLDDCVSITLPWDLDISDPIPAAMLL